jgi:hypothetical protein
MPQKIPCTDISNACREQHALQDQPSALDTVPYALDKAVCSIACQVFRSEINYCWKQGCRQQITRAISDFGLPAIAETKSPTLCAAPQRGFD